MLSIDNVILISYPFFRVAFFYLGVDMGKRETALQKAGKNSKAIWAIIILLLGVLTAIYRIGDYVSQTSDLPMKVKQIEKDVEKIKPIPERMTSLESRTSALELLVASNSAEMKQAYQSIKEDLNILKAGLTRIGLEHNK